MGTKSVANRITVVRGIQNAEGKRIEPGTTVSMADLEKLFDKKTILHWLKRGVLEDAR